MQEKLTKKDMAFVSILLVNEWNHFLLAIWFFFYTKTLGLSAVQTTFLFSGSYLFQLFLEIPTGVVADVKGRIFSYRVGQTLVALSVVPLFITKNFSILIFTVPVFALGSALYSGCLYPVAHSYFEQRITNEFIREKYYRKYISKQNYLGFAYRSAAAIIGAFAYNLNNYLPTLLFLITTLISIILSFFISNKKVEKQREKSLTISKHARQVKEILKTEKHFKYFIVIIFIFQIISSITWNLIQPYFKSQNYSYVNIAIIFCVIALLSASSSRRLSRVKLHYTYKQLIIFYLFFFLIANFMFILLPSNLVLLSVILPGIPNGITNIVVNGYITKYAKNQYLSTLLSITSSIQFFSYFLITQTTGFVLDNNSIARSAQILVLATSVLPFVGLFFLRKIKR